MREALTSAEIDAKKYTGHSFRIGAATTAARKGISADEISSTGALGKLGLSIVHSI